ncbi:MAG: aminopeptidase P family protein [Eubacteriales bacterium]|nr:aminopeptidase P family protein [Eubacteriales bacterium]
MTVKEKVEALRQKMAERGIAAYFVQSSDFHQSEYLAPHFTERAWLTGFTGSAGVAVVTADEALVWADGRYTIQAKNQLAGTPFKPMPWLSSPDAITPQAWLKQKLNRGDKLGYCGAYTSPLIYANWLKPLMDQGVELIEDIDLVGEIWEDRPEMAATTVFELPIEYSGESTADKLQRVREAMRERAVDYTALASLDDVAWLYNIRGRDIEDNPVIFAYALIGEQTAVLYTEVLRVPEEIKELLAKDGVEIRPYEAIYEDLTKLPSDAVFYYDPERFNRLLVKAIPAGMKCKQGLNFTSQFKAIKNSTEEAKQRIAYHLDAIALTKFMYWLDQEIADKGRKITEYEASEYLLSLREQADSFIEPSFTTIAAYGPNAAMMHYAPDPENSPVIEPRGLFLFDSGGQYFEGTTDITRTQAMGELTAEERLAYTYTWKSCLTLLNGRFLQGSTGSGLDSIARYPLWQIGEDYKCGTGHGVGFCLNVHEGPQRLGFKPNSVELEEGMVVTVEPGVYKEGKFGIRIENVCIVKKDIKNDAGQFMKLDILDYIPHDTRPIVVEELTDAELAWINAYQARCYEELKDKLSSEEAAWLKEFCKPLER